MSDDAIDVCVPAVGALVNRKLMIGHTTAYNVLAKMNPVLSAAGIQVNQ